MEMFDRLSKAMYDTVHDFVDRGLRSRGAVALAPKIGLQPGTLSNKVNPTIDTHQLGLRESIPLMLAAKDFSILHAMAAELGHCTYAIPDDCLDSDLELLTQYAEFHARVGLHATSIRAALRDGKINAAEIAEVRRSFDDLVRAGICVLRRLEALVDA